MKTNIRANTNESGERKSRVELFVNTMHDVTDKNQHEIKAKTVEPEK